MPFERAAAWDQGSFDDETVRRAAGDEDNCVATSGARCAALPRAAVRRRTPCRLLLRFDHATPIQVKPPSRAIAYFVLPFDVVPDMLPLSASPMMQRCWVTALRMVAGYITPVTARPRAAHWPTASTDLRAALSCQNPERAERTSRKRCRRPGRISRGPACRADKICTRVLKVFAPSFRRAASRRSHQAAERQGRRRLHSDRGGAETQSGVPEVLTNLGIALCHA